MVPEDDKPRIISFRADLQSEIADILKVENMACPATMEGLLLLIVALSRYREEGVPLFPEVFVCDDAKLLASALQAQDLIRIGFGPRQGPTIRDAVKNCAALAREGWAIFVERAADQFIYGIFRLSSEPLALTSAELMSLSTASSMHAVMAWQLAPNVVELRASCGRCLHLHFSEAQSTDPPPRQAMDRLVEAITTGVPDANDRQDTSRFLRRSFAAALHAGHGSIAAVTKKFGKSVQKIFADRVTLEPHVNVLQRVRDYKAHSGTVELSALAATATLIQGMFQCDGITLFTTDAKILAYRAFVKATDTKNIAGGARLRTFKYLCDAVGSDLVAVFYQSQDGHNEFFRGS